MLLTIFLPSLQALNLTYLCLVTIQMVANTICCCAPVYRTIIPRIPFLSKWKSSISQSFSRGRDNSSRWPKKLTLPTLITIGGTEQKQDGTGQRRAVRNEEWIQLNGSSTHGMSWADVENSTEVETGPAFRQTPSTLDREHQGTQAVHVERSFEVV